MWQRLRHVAFLVVGMAASPASADTVYLKNGAWIDGIVSTRSDVSIIVEVGENGKIEILTEDVYDIEKNSRTGGKESLHEIGRKLDVPEGFKGPGSRRADGNDASRDGASDGDASGDDAGGDASDDESEDGRGGAKSSRTAPIDSDIDPALRERIEQLVDDLQRQKPQFRVRAQRHLKAIGEPAIPFLLPLVDHESDLVRTAVFSVFQSAGDDRVIEASIDALGDTNEYVRDYAQRTLKRVTGEDFGYKPFASPRRRENAVEKWRKWWKKEQAELEKLHDVR